MPATDRPRQSSGAQFFQNQDGLTAEDRSRAVKEFEVTYIARDNPPWITRALHRDKTMQVFVATGRYDLWNMCEGDVAATATLAPDLASRISNHCYESGHVVYRDEQARLQLSRDLANFVRQAVAAQTTSVAVQK